MFFSLETGVPARVKPFGIEVRNVKCLRCGKYGHQSGDRECPLKDVIMPNEESRLKRDDPLTAIVAQTDPSEVGIVFNFAVQKFSDGCHSSILYQSFLFAELGFDPPMERKRSFVNHYHHSFIIIACLKNVKSTRECMDTIFRYPIVFNAACTCPCTHTYTHID